MSTVEPEAAIRGGCQCGVVRFTGRGAPRWVSLCHCTSCRRSAGAVGVAWVGFMASQVDFENQAERHFHSSPGVTRGLCATCGTTLTCRSDARPQTIDLTVGCCDDPERLRPTGADWVEDRVSWAAHLDDLPAHLTLANGPND